MVTPMMLIQPKHLAKVGVVPGAPKMNMINEHTAGAPKWVMP